MFEKERVRPKASFQNLAHTLSTDSWYSIKCATKNTVEISLFDDIGDYGITAKQFERDLNATAKQASSIKLTINSLGGDVIDGTAIYSLLKYHPAKVHVYIVGIAASIASVIAMAGDDITIAENAWLMVHKPWGVQGGNADDMRDYADFLDSFERGLLVAYEKKTGKSSEEISAMLRGETWMMGQEAIDAGFADKLMESVSAHAKLHSNRYEDYLDMPTPAKSFIAPRAQASTDGPTQQQPTPVPSASLPASPSATDTVTTPSPQKSEQEIQAAVLAKEQQRRTDVKAVFNGFPANAELMAACLDDMTCTVDKAREKLLAALGTESAPASGQPVTAISGHVSNGNIVRDGMINAIASRADLEAPENDNPYVGLTLLEAARMCLTEQGVSAYGLSKMDMVANSFTHTSSDFGIVLEDVARKSVMMGYEEAGENFALWTTKANLSDFKLSKKVALDSFPTLDLVPEGGEYKRATFGERGELIQLATYGKLFSISRQAIINDDLSVFTEIPRNMGAAAIRTLGNLVYACVLGSPKMSDGKSLFHNDHGNLMEGAYPTVDVLDTAKTLMALQKDPTNTPLNIRPEFILTSVGQESAFTTLLAAEFNPAYADAKMPNAVRNMATVISDARIDHADKNAYKPWILLNKKAITVAYLDGIETPMLDQQRGWSVDGTEFKVRLDAGVAPMSYRSAIKNPGALPEVA